MSTVWFDNMARARRLISKQAPYYLHTLFAVPIVNTEGCDTFFVTKSNVVGFNPTWLASAPAGLVAGSLIHCAHHILRDHAARAAASFPDVHPGVVNLGMDLAIVPHLQQEGWEVGPNPVHPSMFKLPTNLAWEEYVTKLKELVDPDEALALPCCGSGAGNLHVIEETFLSQLPTGVGAPSKKDLRRALRATAKEAQQGGKHTPFWNTITEYLTDTPPKVPWDQELQGVFRQAYESARVGSADYTYGRQSRRSIGSPIIVPTMVGFMPGISIAIDTSGSMGADVLAIAFNEVRRIMTELGIQEIHVIQGDTEVRSMQRMKVTDLRAPPIHGGGGTDLTAIVKAAANVKPKPDIVVLITDGGGTSTFIPPMKTIVLQIGKAWGGYEESLKQLGKVIEVDASIR